MEKLLHILRNRINHAQKRVNELKELHGKDPLEKYNYFGGHSLDYWEGKLSAYEFILDEIEDSRVDH